MSKVHEVVKKIIPVINEEEVDTCDTSTTNALSDKGMLTTDIWDSGKKEISVKSSFEQKLEHRLSKSKSAPLSERTFNEELLKQVGIEAKKVRNAASAAKVGAAAGGMVAGMVAAPVTGGSIALNIALKVATEVSAATTNSIVEQQTQKSKDIFEQASKITNLPPKEDILLHFGANKDKYKKACLVLEREFGSDEPPKKFVNFFQENLTRIRGKIIEEILALYYGFKDLSIMDKALVIAAMGYLFSPIDMVPDAIPLIGFADDAVVINYIFERVMSMISDDVRSKIETLRNQWNVCSSSDLTEEDTAINKEYCDESEHIDQTPEEIGGVKTINRF